MLCKCIGTALLASGSSCRRYMYFIASSLGGCRSLRRVAWLSVLGLSVGRHASHLYSERNAMRRQVPKLPV